MARGRMLNNSISRSLKFDLLPDDTCRLLATWIISHLDFRGVFYADPVMVKSLVFTRRSDVTNEQIEGYLQVMVRIGLITLFEAKDQRWQRWPEFAANQVGLRAEREKTDFPVPPDYLPVPAASPPGDGKETASGRQGGGKETAEENLKLSESQLEDQDRLKNETPSAATAPPSEPKSKSKSKRKEPSQKQQEAQAMFSALAKVCQIDLVTITGIQRKQLNQSGLRLRKANATPADMELFATWWYANDWRGKKGDAPRPAQVRETWGKFKTWREGGQHTGPQPHAGIRQWLADEGVQTQ